MKFGLWSELDRVMQSYATCENHADRKGVLTVDLPSVGVRRFMCEECRAAFTATYTQFKGKREAWEQGSDYSMSGGALHYDSTRGRVQLSGYENEPNERYK